MAVGRQKRVAALWEGMLRMAMRTGSGCEVHVASCAQLARKGHTCGCELRQVRFHDLLGFEVALKERGKQGQISGPCCFCGGKGDKPLWIWQRWKLSTRWWLCMTSPPMRDVTTSCSLHTQKWNVRGSRHSSMSQGLRSPWEK
jgi:hypothetical protein